MTKLFETMALVPKRICEAQHDAVVTIAYEKGRGYNGQYEAAIDARPTKELEAAWQRFYDAASEPRLTYVKAARTIMSFCRICDEKLPEHRHDCALAEMIKQMEAKGA